MFFELQVKNLFRSKFTITTLYNINLGLMIAIPMGFEPIITAVTVLYLHLADPGMLNNKRTLGEYNCYILQELNLLPKVPKTFALPNELKIRSNSYLLLLIILWKWRCAESNCGVPYFQYKIFIQFVFSVILRVNRTLYYNIMLLYKLGCL